jgi:hypothetical protein
MPEPRYYIVSDEFGNSTICDRQDPGPYNSPDGTMQTNEAMCQRLNDLTKERDELRDFIIDTEDDLWSTSPHDIAGHIGDLWIRLYGGDQPARSTKLHESCKPTATGCNGVCGECGVCPDGKCRGQHG